MKAKRCDECRHWRGGSFGAPDCAKGHRPRFYLPTSIAGAHRGDFGFKRRCGDFEEARDAGK